MTSLQERSEPTWVVPSLDAAIVECRTLYLSQILDRMDELQKVRRKADRDSDEYKRASVMEVAAYRVMHSGEYRKVQP